MRETLLSQPLWDRPEHQVMAPAEKTAPLFAVSK